jgi:hypothetical protein
LRYKADITAGALKLPESRLIADLLLREVDAAGWKDAIVDRNVLQTRSPATAIRFMRLIRGRLETMGPDLWKLVRDGKGDVAAAPGIFEMLHQVRVQVNPPLGSKKGTKAGGRGSGGQRGGRIGRFWGAAAKGVGRFERKLVANVFQQLILPLNDA